MTLDRHVAQWVAQYPLQPVHVDCAIAVMLKIIDGKCKMPAVEKRVMEVLYDHVAHEPHERLAPELHHLIRRARVDHTEEVKLEVYEQRVLAETTISRPVMKAFKAMIRSRGLLDRNIIAGVDEDLD